MKKLKLLLIIFTLLAPMLWAQEVGKPVKAPEITHFAPILEFLSSPLLQGRETGTHEAEITSVYIASMMKRVGLHPYGDISSTENGVFSPYFQKFDLLKYTLEKAAVVATSFEKAQTPQLLNPFSDYTLLYGYESFNVESPIVFAGYGIHAEKLNYNDYNQLDVNGKVVLILEGYPGETDTTGKAWKIFKESIHSDAYSIEQKCKEAKVQGASAIMVISKEWLEMPTDNVLPSNQNDDLYSDADYLLPNEKPKDVVPCFLLSKTGSNKLAKALHLDLHSKMQEISKKFNFKSIKENNSIRISVQIHEEIIHVSNVLSLLKGKDTTQMVIIGAHYDHLGIRGNDIYTGADDNASGVAGLLTLAENWAQLDDKPACNILFASWTAEEKGLIGSNYFAGTLTKPEKVGLYINLDMISRSVAEDAKHNQLSIGTRTLDDNLRLMANKTNSTLAHPFELDFWDVTGHSGSDYASFTSKNIPVMTYNSGLHSDYHTTRDVASGVDFVKMKDVLTVVNGCLFQYLETLKTFR